MEPKTIIILVLIGYMVFWYNNPDKGKDYLDMGVNKTQALIGGLTGEECPTTYDPVCAGNTNYNNQCLAEKAGHTEITLGVCVN